MKIVAVALLAVFPFFAHAQPPPEPKNIIIITIDGFRWQEIFNGADPSLLADTSFVNDTTLMQELYAGNTPEIRRQKLLPFFWNVIAMKGQLSGNRQYDNKVNTSNLYKISYPGYSEMLTGYSDLRPVLNTPVQNRNTNILEYLNTEPEYAGKVVAFSSWNIFPYILNEARSGIPVNSGYESIEETDSSSIYINQVQEKVKGKTHCRYDQLTFLAARDYIQQQHPRVVLISFGETDEFAHHKRYDRYLQQANSIDKMIAELWYLVQTDPFYKNNTSLIITTDHGRGKKSSSWYAHNLFVKGSGETWLAMLGAGITATGEKRSAEQTYQKQLAATVAQLLGKRFTSNHAPAEALVLQENKTASLVLPVIGSSVDERLRR